jgi:hypothetical protein
MYLHITIHRTPADFFKSIMIGSYRRAKRDPNNLWYALSPRIDAMAPLYLRFRIYITE